jgi:hypothetical protein
MPFIMSYTPIEQEKRNTSYDGRWPTTALRITSAISHLFSFPLMMGEGEDGGEHLRPYPPYLNPPPPWGRKLFFASIGVIAFIQDEWEETDISFIRDRMSSRFSFGTRGFVPSRPPRQEVGRDRMAEKRRNLPPFSLSLNSEEKDGVLKIFLLPHSLGNRSPVYCSP